MKTILLVGAVVLSCGVILPGCGSPSPAELVKAGISEFQLGRPDTAKEMLQRALAQEPSHPAALFYMARIHHAQKSYVQAIYYYQCCLDADPANLEAANYLRQAQQEAGSAGGAPGGA